MLGIRANRRRLFGAIALVAGLLAVVSMTGTAAGVSILMPPSVELSGKTNRRHLPPATPRPITLSLVGKISEPGAEERRPPPVTKLSMRFDRAGTISTEGLPSCRPVGSPDFEWSRCAKALVGKGKVEIEVSLPGHPSYRTEGALEVFNGLPKGGDPVFIYKVLARLPAPATFVTSGVIERDHGKFGTQTTVEVPTVASGYGSLVGFRVRIGKAWRYEGKRVSLLSASCPTGKLSAAGEFEFSTGLQTRGTIEEPCG